MAINHIKQIGQEAMLAKIDFKSAFWLLPVYPADHHLLGRINCTLTPANPSGFGPLLSYLTLWQTC